MGSQKTEQSTPPVGGIEQTPPAGEAEINTLLSKEVLAVAEKIDNHINDLDSIIQNNKADTTIAEKHKKLEEEANAVLSKVTDEHQLTDEARIAMHGLQDRILSSTNQAQGAQETAFENSSAAAKTKILVDKYKFPAAITIGVGKALWEIHQNVKKKKGFWKKTRGRVKGIFSGLLRGGVSYGVMHGASYVAGLVDELDPRKWAGDAKASMSGRRSKITGKDPKGEVYDPKNQETRDARQDSDPEKPGFEGPDLWMDDLNQPIFGRKDGRTEKAVLPGDMLIAGAHQSDQIDMLYNDPTFTDKYLLFVKAINMRTQAARKADQSGGFFSKKDSGIGSIQLREQELLEIQEAVSSKKNKTTILGLMKKTMDGIYNFESTQKGVIGQEWKNDVIPLIVNYKAPTGEARKSYLTDKEVLLYDAFTKTGGFTYGDNDVVKRRIYDDFLQTSKYQKMDDLFEGDAGEKLFAELEKIEPQAKSDEQVSKLIGTHLRTSGYLKTSNNKGLPENSIGIMTENIITTYHKTKEQIKANNGQFKKFLNRAYSSKLDIDQDPEGQKKMIAGYEQMYGPEAISAYAKKHNIAYTAQEKRNAIRGFAFDIMEKNMLHGAVISIYQDVFFDQYLPSQMVQVGSSQPSSTNSLGISNGGGSYYAYKDKKENLLASVIGAGSKVSYDTINAAIQIGANIAVSLIPIVGTEIAVARLAGGLIARGIFSASSIGGRVALLGMRAVVGHVAMSTFTGIAQEKSVNEIFTNMFDWKEFAQNAIFFGVVGQVGPWIAKNVGKISKFGKVAPETLETLSKHRMGRLAFMTGSGAAETAVIEGSRALLDPKYTWNRHEVFTVFMLSTLLAGKVGKKAREYTAVKTAEGKLKLTMKKNMGKEVHAFAKEVSVKQLKWSEKYLTGWSKKTEQRAAEGKVFTKEGYSFQFAKNTKGEIELLDATTKKVIRPEDVQTFKSLLATQHASLASNAGNRLSRAAQNSTTSLQQAVERSGTKRSDFLARSKTQSIILTEKATVGDLFKLIGEKKIGKLLFDPIKLKKLSKQQMLVPTNILRRGLFIAKNASSLFTRGSLIYGTTVGDGGDRGRDEGLENYFLYGVIGRGIVGKLALYLLDSSDIII